MKKDIISRISILFIIVGIILKISNTVINDYKKVYDEKNARLIIDSMNDNSHASINHVYKTNIINNYIAVLEIPKIGLRKGLFFPNSKNNNVSKNIAILKPIQMPSEKNSTFILASHSGTSDVSYFNDLYKLRYKDKVYVYYNNVKYKYMINDYYEEKKTGSIIIKSNSNIKTIVLTTCKPISFNKQLVYIGYLYDEEYL